MLLESLCNKYFIYLFFVFCFSFAFSEGITGNEKAEFFLDETSTQFKSYENSFYSLKVVGRKLVVKSNIDILKSKTKFPIKINEKSALSVLRQSFKNENYRDFYKNNKIKNQIKFIKKNAKGYFQAVDSVLRWTASNFSYCDMQKSVLEGNCVTVAKLVVYMCTHLNIPARVVNGIVVSKESKVLSGAALHTFVEIYYPDYGWIFSDPLEYFHFVPATYIYIDKIDEQSLFAIKINRKKYLKKLQFVDILDNSSNVKSRVNLFRFPALK